MHEARLSSCYAFINHLFHTMQFHFQQRLERKYLTVVKPFLTNVNSLISCILCMCMFIARSRTGYRLGKYKYTHTCVSTSRAYFKCYYKCYYWHKKHLMEHSCAKNHRNKCTMYPKQDAASLVMGLPFGCIYWCERDALLLKTHPTPQHADVKLEKVVLTLSMAVWVATYTSDNELWLYLLKTTTY